MNDKIHSKETDFLFSAVMSLNTLEECYSFFEDICTAGEILSLAQRLSVAKCLYEGRTNAETKEITGAAAATISRVNRSLRFGSDGYRAVIEKLAKNGGDEVFE